MKSSSTRRRTRSTASSQPVLAGVTAPGLYPRAFARADVFASNACMSGRRGARRCRGRSSGGRHRCRRGRRRRTLVPSPRHRRRGGRLRDGRLIVLDGAGECAGRGRRSGGRSLRGRRCRCGRCAHGRSRLRRLRAGTRRTVGVACEHGHAGEPESERESAGADERDPPGARPAAGLVPSDLAATFPAGSRRRLIVRCERFTDG